MSRLPYLNDKDYNILLDTGSSINLINKNFVYKSKSKFKIFKEKFEFNTATGVTKGTEYVFLKIEGQPIKCYLCDFHKNFNVLLGLPALKLLKTSWIIDRDLVKMGNRIFKLQYLNERKENICKKENNLIETKKVEIRSNHLNKQEKYELEKLLKEFHMLFPKDGEILSHVSNIKHKINTTDDIPIYSRQYRYPYAYKKEIDNQVEDLLKKDIIRESYSPWSSPIWIVPKKMDASNKQKYRMVVDYRKLNAKTVDDKFPIPNITEVLDKLGRNVYFTTLDLTSGFHQIEMEKESISKTAFNTDRGHFEFKRMPFGLKNAPATFQRMMNSILKDQINKKCLVYLDDIIVFGTSLQEHIGNLREIFKKLQENNLKIQPDKSEFLMKEVGYLGHIISENGIQPNPDKIVTIKNYPIDRKSVV